MDAETLAQPQAWTPFVGRDRELREVLEALDETRSGRGRLILLGGEPGIGKSRLADELATRARERGHLVLWGRGWEDAGAPPYWPWVQAFRAYLRATNSEDVRRHMGSGARDVAQMLPELYELLPDLPLAPTSESESARFQLFDSAATFLRNAGRACALLVVLDDLHAADTPSILFLRFLASQLSDMRVLLVGTYRDVELTPEHPLTSAIAEMAREPLTRTLVLAGLESGAVRRFIGATANLTPDDRVVAAILRETSGNPLFVGEAVRLLSAEGRLSEVADLSSLRVVVPAGVRAVIARRIGHLGEATARGLELGAALGPEFNLEILRRIAGYDGDQALDVIDEAVHAGLLLPVAGTLDRYRFSHDLVRETLYNELSPGRRARLHRRIAHVLEDVHRASIDAHLAELAFHCFEAAKGGDAGLPEGDLEAAGPRAIDYARRAGDQAARSLAYEEADRLYGMALAEFDLADTEDERARTEILLALGEVRARAGDLERARATYLQAADAARRTGAADHLAQAALGYGGRLPWMRPGNDALLIPLLQDALVMLGGSNKRLRVRLLARLACAWRSSPERRNDSATLSQQAVELARGLDDPGTLSYALAGRYWATWWAENPLERHPIATELVSIAEALRDGERLIDAQLILFMDRSQLGQMSEARDALETVGRLAEELRQPDHLWLGVAPRAMLALMEGDFPLAEELVQRETDSRRQITTARDDESARSMHRFLLRREQGRLAEEEATVRASADDFPWYPLHRAALACVLLDLHREAEARAVFEDLARDEFRALYRDNMWLLGISLASEACAQLGDGPASKVLHEQLRPFAGRHAIGHAEGSVGAVDRYLGLLAATLGHLDDAVTHLEAAIEINEGWGARPWAAHSQHDLAQVLIRRDAPGDRDRAAQLDRAALGISLELGMVLAQEIQAHQTQAAAEPPSATPAHELSPVSRDWSFRLEGEYWEIGGDQLVRLRDGKGLRYLAGLLALPGREIHALDLAAGGEARGSPPSAREAAELGLRLDDGLGLEGGIDEQARAAYRTRLRDLQAELDEAESFNDPARAVRAQEEMEALEAELSAAYGLGGRARPAITAAERARQSVTKAIKDALRRITLQDPAVGEHLARSVHTGRYCTYDPDPAAFVHWSL